MPYERINETDPLVMLADLIDNDTIGAIQTGLEALEGTAFEGTAEAGVTLTQSVPTRQFVFSFTDLEVTIGNTTGISFGSVQLGTLPQGQLRVDSVMVDVAFGLENVGNVTPVDGDDNGDFALGTVATAAGALTSTEANILASTAVAYDTDIAVENVTPKTVDLQAAVPDLFLNITVDDADVGDGADDVVELTGSVTVTVTNWGFVA